jgi:streptomycin 6-kinase
MMADPRLEPMLRDWQLELDDPAPAHAAAASIVFVRRGSARLAVKMPDARGNAAVWRGLRHFAGEGAVRVLDQSSSGALLMERAIPGDALSKLVLNGADDSAMAILCDVAARLHAAAPPTEVFPKVDDRQRKFQRRVGVDESSPPARMWDHAQHLFSELATSQTERKLLHGDLHHDNVVYDTARGWLAIDPHGMMGEPAFELAAAFREPNDKPPWFVTRSVVDRRARIVAERLGIDRQRLLGWAFAEAVLLAIWCRREGYEDRSFINVAEAVFPHL